MGSLVKWVQDDAPEESERLRQAHRPKFDIAPLVAAANEPSAVKVEAVKGGIQNDMEATQRIVEIYPHIKCCGGSLYVFDQKHGMWKPDDHFITFKRILMDHADELTVEVSENSKKKPQSYGSTNCLMNNVCQLIKSATVDDTWLDRTERSGKYKLLFKNGIYDMRAKTFAVGFDPDVVFFDNIPCDFPERDPQVMAQLQQAFFVRPFQAEQVASGVGDYLKRRIAQGIAGHFVKDFHLGLGESGAGKTVLVGMVKHAFGGYVDEFNAENMCSRSGEDDARNYRWALNFRHKRILFSNEVKMGVALNGCTMKKMSGGDTLVGRQHGGNETSFSIDFMWIIFANDLPKITPLDDGIKNRARCASYNKTFVVADSDTPLKENQERADLLMGEKIRSAEWRGAFIHLILEAYQHEPLTVPEPVTTAFKEWTAGTTFHDLFDDKFQVVLNDPPCATNFICNDYFTQWRQEMRLHMSAKKFADEMKKMGLESGQRCRGKRGFYNVQERMDG